MTRSLRALCAAAGLLGIPLAAPARAADKPGVDARAAFATLKSLAGEWKADVTHEKGHAGAEHGLKVVYRVTANGSAVLETIFPGTDHEMVTMYHLDGDDLRLTHYCAAGNQPRLKLDRKASTADHYEFAFDGGTNLDPARDMHMHAGRMDVHDGRIVSEWDGYKDGKKIGTNRFVLTPIKK